jgi:hypothetical protein
MRRTRNETACISRGKCTLLSIIRKREEPASAGKTEIKKTSFIIIMNINWSLDKSIQVCKFGVN